MTHNPTQAEVQAAYDEVLDTMDNMAGPTYESVEVLLAAVARDTLGWREVKPGEITQSSGTVRIHINHDDASASNRYFIKDAPT